MLVYLRTTDEEVNQEVGFPGHTEHPAILRNGSIIFYYVECNKPHPGWRAKISPDGTLTINRGEAGKVVRKGLTFLHSGSPMGPWKPVFMGEIGPGWTFQFVPEGTNQPVAQFEITGPLSREDVIISVPVDHGRSVSFNAEDGTGHPDSSHLQARFLAPSCDWQLTFEQVPLPEKE